MVTTAQTIEGRNGEMKEREEKKMTFVDLVRGIEVKNNGSGFPVIIRTEAHRGWTYGWLALVQGENPNVRGGLVQVFCQDDENDLNRRGNGYRIYEIREAGVFQAESVLKSFCPFRAFIGIDHDGNVTIISTNIHRSLREAKKKAIEWLSQLKSGQK